MTFLAVSLKWLTERKRSISLLPRSYPRSPHKFRFTKLSELTPAQRLYGLCYRTVCLAYGIDSALRNKRTCCEPFLKIRGGWTLCEEVVKLLTSPTCPYALPRGFWSDTGLTSGRENSTRKCSPVQVTYIGVVRRYLRTVGDYINVVG